MIFCSGRDDSVFLAGLDQRLFQFLYIFFQNYEALAFVHSGYARRNVFVALFHTAGDYSS